MGPAGRRADAGHVLSGTQEPADLRPPDTPSLADQVLGNVTTLIAHRQVVPESAETLAGSERAVRGRIPNALRPSWAPARRPAEGTRTRTREFVVHPDTIKRLPSGYAAVTRPAHRPCEPSAGRPMTHPNDNAPRLDTPLLTPAEAAGLLAVRPSSIYEAVRAGALPCLRIGRHIRFTRAMLEEWLQGRVA